MKNAQVEKIYDPNYDEQKLKKEKTVNFELLSESNGQSSAHLSPKNNIIKDQKSSRSVTSKTRVIDFKQL